MKAMTGEQLPNGFSIIKKKYLHHKPYIGAKLVNPERLTNELEKPNLTIMIDSRTGKTRQIIRTGQGYTTDQDNRKYIVKLGTALTTARKLYRKELRPDNGIQLDMFSQLATVPTVTKEPEPIGVLTVREMRPEEREQAEKEKHAKQSILF